MTLYKNVLDSVSVPEAARSTRAVVAISIAVFGWSIALGAKSSIAQSASQFGMRVNSSGICATLPELNVAKVAELIGVSIGLPSFFKIDLKGRWDKDRHSVHFFRVEGSEYVAELTIGCQPSDQGAIIQELPIAAEDIRLTDSVRCEGSIRDVPSESSTDCDVSGEIGSFIARYVDLESYVASSLP